MSRTSSSVSSDFSDSDEIGVSTGVAATLYFTFFSFFFLGSFFGLGSLGSGVYSSSSGEDSSDSVGVCIGVFGFGFFFFSFFSFLASAFSILSVSILSLSVSDKSVSNSEEDSSSSSASLGKRHHRILDWQRCNLSS